MNLEEYKKELVDYLSDEYSFSKQHGDVASMSLIEDIFKKMDLDFSAIDFINSN